MRRFVEWLIALTFILILLVGFFSFFPNILAEISCPIPVERIKFYSDQYPVKDLAEELIATLSVESGCNPEAVSSAGARGIAQFIPSTAKAVWQSLGNQGQPDLHDIETSLAISSRYLNDKYQKFNDWNKVRAVYNAGEGGAAGYLVTGNERILPRETQYHIKKIAQARQFFQESLGQNLSGTPPTRFMPRSIISFVRLIDLTNPFSFLL